MASIDNYSITSLSHHEKVKVSKTKHGLCIRGFFVRALSCEFFFATGSVGPLMGTLACYVRINR